MSIWEAILKACGQLSPGREFGLMLKGFKRFQDDGSLIDAGLTEMVRVYTAKLVSDGCVSRRMRELAKPKYWKQFGIAFDYEVVRRGWYRVTRLEPFIPRADSDSAGTVYVIPQEVVNFQPVDGQGGELHLF